MMGLVVLLISTILQYVSAWLALRLNKVTGYSFAWTLLAVSIGMMGVRRTYSLVSKVSSGKSIDASAELIALSISVIMLLSLLAIKPLLVKAINEKGKGEFDDTVVEESDTVTFSQKPLYFSSVLILLLGVIVICGWHLHIPALLQIHPSFVPMQYNTALGFLLGGICLIAFCLKKSLFFKFSFIFLLLVGGLTLLQYLFGMDFGIDELLMKHEVTVKTSHPGRMAPNTAVCFILLALSILSLRFRDKKIKYISPLLICLLLAFSAVAFFGYLSGIETAHGWGKMTRMALHTSAGFLVAGVGVFAYIWNVDSHESPIPKWLPLVLMIGGSTTTVVLWQAMNSNEAKKLQKILEVKADFIGEEIQAIMEGQFKALERMAARWNGHGGTPYNEWIKDADNYVNDFVGYDYLLWVDSKGFERWKAHKGSVDDVSSKQSVFAPGLSLGKARKGLFLHYSEKEKYSSKLIAIVSVFNKGLEDGFLVGVFDFNKLVYNEEFRRHVDKTYKIKVTKNSKTIVDYGYDDLVIDLEQSNKLLLRGEEFEILMSPDKSFINSQNSEINTFIFFMGIITSLALSLISFFWNKIYESEKRLRRSERKIKSTLKELNDQQNKLIEAREDAVIASKSKSEFLANMSHEIRTPMTAILGYIGLFGENEDQLTDEMKEQVKVIERNGNHLLTIINDILDLSKIEAGKLEIEFIPFSLTELVDDIEDLLRPKAVEKNVALDVVWRFPLPTKVESDPTRIRQILLNLLGNSLKFTSKGNVTLEIGWESEYVLFKVSDTGIGMSKEQLAKIFSSFEQADTSITREFGGTGLGLTITKRLTEMLGGEITVESEFGKGSTFAFKVLTKSYSSKMLEEKPQKQEVKKVAEVSEISGNILLVDDNMTNLRLISKILTKMNLQVECCMDGSQAVDMVIHRGMDFDMVIMDVQMPVMDGLTAAGILKQNSYSKPVIALTANTMKGDKEKCLEAGYTDFAAKPINKKDLSEILHKYL